MMELACNRAFSRRGAGMIGTAMLALLAATVQPAIAAGPFADLGGQWSGTGMIRLEKQAPERIRCTSSNRLRGSSQNEIDLTLKCDSDNYHFDFSGEVEAGADGTINGRWTERSRSVGGSVIGKATGNRIQIHIETSAFAGNLLIVTQGRRMTVNIDSAGGGVKAQTTISMEGRR